MLQSNIIGIDLAKNILQICHISKHGELISNKAVSRQKLKQILANQQPAVVAIEGCGSSHYWGRYAEEFGHDVRIISPKKVKGFLQGHKTDANDALAIANASLQIGLKTSKPKNEEQQTLQTLETSQLFLSRGITSLSNHLRALLYEYGIVSTVGVKGLTKAVLETLDEASLLPECLRSTVNQLWIIYLNLKTELAQLIKTKNGLVRQLQPCKALMGLESVAEVCAGMLYSSIGDGKQFKNGREASAFIGLTPKQHSSGGKVFMTGIDRAGGIKELRSALYQGALSYICRLADEPKTAKQAWLIKLVQRAGIKRSCIALANKTVRTAWAMLRYENKYKQQPLLAI
ncbi:transposase IS116/IS110/IS902 family protein [Psychromonas ingrahamii 37]|uniref:Transposase IS116/IS110/IS902 family protein n=1 Tax=Psychromonas ingrahamii (strain DSM 17664 / CCUG 51855 / 37) TaxID=357804 RepID=A1SZA7_PSYIN|nr:IS110 family transposase [Psychromonas ingrahamii]ABM04822.1 transposase IS116/IS110/IS902 family protein [Psychromonas ingrahamii 37]